MGINDYEFTETCFNFLKEIEVMYEEKILIEEKSLNDSEHGFAKFENGIPIIEINVDEQFKTDVILHEAFHLKLKVEGMPNIGFELPNGMNTESNKIYLNWFTHLFWDKVTHYYFYKIFDKKLDVSPYNPFKVEIDIVIESGEIKNLAEGTKEISLSGYLLQVFVETNDQDYINKFKDFLIEKYESVGIEKGVKLIQIFEENPIDNFEDCIKLFILLFDFIHLEQGIKIKGFKKEYKKSKKVIENFIYFGII